MARKTKAGSKTEADAEIMPYSPVFMQPYTNKNPVVDFLIGLLLYWSESGFWKKATEICNKFASNI